MEFHTAVDKLHPEKASGEDQDKMHSVLQEGEHRSGSTTHLSWCPHILFDRGCQHSIKRKDEPTHKEECLYAVIACEQCHQNTTVANKELHLEKTCPRGEIHCPLKCKKHPRRCGHKALYIIISNLKMKFSLVCNKTIWCGYAVSCIRIFKLSPVRPY